MNLGIVNFNKIAKHDLKWLQMGRNGLKLSQNEDLSLNIILKQILDPKWANNNLKPQNNNKI